MGAGYRHEDRTYINPLEKVEVQSGGYGPTMYWDAWQLVKWGLFGSTIHMVSNCEDITDWDISDATQMDAADEVGAGHFRTGSTSMELMDDSTTKGTFVTLDVGHRPCKPTGNANSYERNGEDWREFNWICMWVHDDTAARLADELKFQIRNDGDWATAQSVPINVGADVWELKCIDISSVTRANVDGFRFVNNRGTGSDEKVYIDSIFVTDLITGEGSNTEAMAGPVDGPVRAMPIATGQTLLPGDGVLWSKCQVSAAAENSDAVIGYVCQTDDFASRTSTDVKPTYALIASQGANAYGMAVGTGTLGEAAELAASELGFTDAGTGAEEIDSSVRFIETGTDNFHVGVHIMLQAIND